VSAQDWVEKDFYATLGVAKEAKAAELKKAYRTLARELHPDKNPGNAASEARFKEVSEAYDVLSDAKTRAEYDEARSLFGSGGFRRASGSGGMGGGAGAFDFSSMFGDGAQPSGSGGGDLGDMFGGLFGGGGRGGGRTFRHTGRAGQSSQRGPARGSDAQAEVTLGFDEAVHGQTLPLRLSGPAACDLCRGSGAAPGTSPHQCAVCGGSGYISRNQGAFGFSEPCRACQGTGQVIDTPCQKCQGAGVTAQVRTITVRVPPGVRDGAKLKIPGKGQPGVRGGPAGDLYVTVHVLGHELFGRSGDDLTLTAPITFAEAALGTTLRVPTLGASVALRIAPGTASGRTLRVRGRGAPKRAGGNGDLLVTVDVAVPQNLSVAAREALAAFALTQTDDPRPNITGALGLSGSGSAAKPAAAGATTGGVTDEA
jgi:molecular chaperone DnaJ